MASDSKKTITWSADSPEHKQYMNRIAIEKGFKSIGDMSRYATAKLFTGYRIPFLPESPVTGRDENRGGG